jgi:glycosyltransferase involved in cell wall biosynthesis
VRPESETNTTDERASVVLLHNRYREEGGEERSVAAIAALLRSRGHSVTAIERTSGALTGTRGRVRAASAMLRGGASPAPVSAVATGADVVHAHNINPLLGPRALAAARAAGATVVMHLHNYRLFCAIAIGYRDHARCTRCHARNTFPGVRLRCRGNLPEAAVYGAALALQQPRVLETVDRFVAPSRAAAAMLERFGFPADRLDVMANFVGDDDFARASAAAEGEYALFAGRLTEEKGADTAISAARRAGVPLVVAGTGPDAARLRELAGGDESVRFLGRVPPEEMPELRRGAAFAVVPSRWDEPCPYVVIEAMAAGLPVLASDVGGLPEMVGGGLLDANAAGEWADAMAALWGDPALRAERGAGALARARELFGQERAYSELMAIYDRARAAR